MRIELVKGVNLNIIPSKQFKTTRIFISFIKNIESKKELAERALLANYLEMCSQNYPTQIDIARKLSQMYGASFGSSVDRRGNYQLINFSIDYIESKYLAFFDKHPSHQRLLTFQHLHFHQMMVLVESHCQSKAFLILLQHKLAYLL